MTASEVDAYIAKLDEPKRTTLETVRRTVRELLPEAEECISYKIPGFRVRGTMIAGLAAFKNHLSYFPHSGSVLPELEDELTAYEHNKGTLQFPIDTPLPRPLVKKLISVRMRQAFEQ